MESASVMIMSSVSLVLRIYTLFPASPPLLSTTTLTPLYQHNVRASDYLFSLPSTYLGGDGDGGSSLTSRPGPSSPSPSPGPSPSPSPSPSPRPSSAEVGAEAGGVGELGVAVDAIKLSDEDDNALACLLHQLNLR